MTIDYLAGLVDGEGCFQLWKGRKGNASDFRAPRLTINMTTPEPLRRAQETFGGRLYGPYKPKPNSRKPFWVWCIADKPTLRKVLPDLIPHLLVKREQAEALLPYLPDFTGKKVDVA